MRVLLIDNALSDLNWLVERLDDKGDTVISASNFEHGRQLIREDEFHCAIVDVVMPAPQNTSHPDPDVEAQSIGLVLCKQLLGTKWGRGRVAVYTVLQSDELDLMARRIDLEPTEIRHFTKSEDGTQGLLAFLDSVRSRVQQR